VLSALATILKGTFRPVLQKIARYLSSPAQGR
jgi:hypothetical protein